ncbi:MAG TPA: hypothetical protein VNT24_03310 [Propionibacteriaceae bacterium]|nr:hypothetical protein [Propionibacteriaceae bacterium]
MLIETSPPRQRTNGPQLWAMTSGITGLAANLLLVLFFLLAQPFGEVRPGFMWLGTANDWLIVVQFLTLVPVALAVRGRLPVTRAVTLATAAAVAAMVGTALLQLLLIAGVLEFDVQVWLIVPLFLVIYGWVLTTSSTGHRHGTLPRPLTRFGLLLGMCFPLGMLIAAAGLPFGWGSVAQLAFGVPGLLVGGLSWLALPVWPLLLARLVFTTPNEKGMS